jgi:DNA polymerase-3 subunit beta
MPKTTERSFFDISIIKYTFVIRPKIEKMILEFTPEFFLPHLKYLNFFLSGSLYGRYSDCILFDLKNSIITLSTNNQKLASRLVLAQPAASMGLATMNFLINGKLFYELLSKLPGKEVVTLRYQDNTVFFSSPSGSYNLSAPSGQDFELPPIPTGGSTYTMTESDLHYIISHLEGFTANDDTFASLKGVLFTQVSDCLHIVATDRSKLAMVAFPIECDIPRSCIVPMGFLSAIKHLLTKTDANITLGFFGNFVYLERDTFVSFCPLIDEQYPNYNAVINYDGSIGIPLPVSTLKESLSRISCLSDVNAPLVELFFENNSLTISSRNKLTFAKEVLALSPGSTPAKPNCYSMVLSSGSLLNILDFYTHDCTAYLANGKPVVFKSREQPNLTYVQTPYFK